MTSTKPSTNPTSFNPTRLLLILGVSVLLVLEGFAGYQVHTLSGRQEVVKKDYSAINNVTFGLLSVTSWRDKITDIAQHRIKNFQLTPQQQQDLQKEVEQVLYALLKKADSLINKPQKSIGGKLKKLAYHAFVNEDKIKAQVPIFAKTIIEKVNSPSSKARLSDLAESKLKQLDKQTYDSTEYADKKSIDSIYSKYHVNSTPDFDKKTDTALNQIRHTTYGYSFAMFGCILVILGLWWLLRNRMEMHAALFVLSIVSALILLLTGITTTMIEVDARISSLHFLLLGETIRFDNQVLFFQSKSILDVVLILLKTGKYDSIIVGFLILCFSILFPIAKLSATGIYLLSKKKWAKNKVVNYFAFHSGKWSMADVMVIAILMTYIGFNGILESAMGGLNMHTDALTSIATNKTALQPGYIVFVAFVLYGLVLSQILKSVVRVDEKDQ